MSSGKERDSESGLDMFGARYYGSSLGRFMQVDPKQFSLRTLLNPQKWNKYAYVLNNPLALVDPNGMEEVTIQVNAMIQKANVGYGSLSFRGDNRGFSSDMKTGTAHSRVSVTMRIETDPAKNHGNPLIGKPEVTVNPTHFNLTGSEKTSTGPQMPEVTATQDKNGNVNVNLQESMRNPFTPPGSGSINTDLNISVNQNATNAEVSGTVSGSPSFEANFSVDGGSSLNVPLQTEPSSTAGFGLGLQQTNNVDQKVDLPPPPKCTDKTTCSNSERRKAVMKMAASFLLVVGCMWALFMGWLLLVFGGAAADSLVGWAKAAPYWGGMLAGPAVLITGSVLLLRGTPLRTGATLVGIGCIILTGFALYNSITGLQRKPLQAPPPYLFYVALLLIMIFSDAAVYKIYKAVGGLR